MITCKDCKHWEPTYTRESGKPVGWRKCTLIPMMDHVTTWSKDLEAHQLLEQYSGLKAAVQDGSSYAADLYTAPDFFCYHGEAA